MASIESRNNKNGKTYRVRLSDGESPNRPRIGFGRITKRQAETAKIVTVHGYFHSIRQHTQDQIPVSEIFNSLRNILKGMILVFSSGGPRLPDNSHSKWLEDEF